MIKVDELPEPGVLLAPANFALWAVSNLELALAHEDNFQQLKKKQMSAELITMMDLEMNAQSRAVCSAILFAALEVEATLNFYGVILLGNEYYDRNLERLKPEEKLAGIVSIAAGQLIEEKDEINVVLKRVFKARNKVAHPKTKAFKDWDSVKDPKDETVATARQAVADMSRFLELFRALAPQSFHSTLRDEEPEDQPDSP